MLNVWQGSVGLASQLDTCVSHADALKTQLSKPSLKTVSMSTSSRHKAVSWFHARARTHTHAHSHTHTHTYTHMQSHSYTHTYTKYANVNLQDLDWVPEKQMMAMLRYTDEPLTEHSQYKFTTTSFCTCDSYHHICDIYHHICDIYHHICDGCLCDIIYRKLHFKEQLQAIGPKPTWLHSLRATLNLRTAHSGMSWSRSSTNTSELDCMLDLT